LKTCMWNRQSKFCWVCVNRQRRQQGPRHRLGRGRPRCWGSCMGGIVPPRSTALGRCGSDDRRGSRAGECTLGFRHPSWGRPCRCPRVPRLSCAQAADVTHLHGRRNFWFSKIEQDWVSFALLTERESPQTQLQALSEAAPCLPPEHPFS
jgi:hypothetical protein